MTRTKNESVLKSKHVCILYLKKILKTYGHSSSSNDLTREM